MYYRTLKEVIHHIWCAFLYLCYSVLNEQCAHVNEYGFQKEASSCGNIVPNVARPLIKYSQFSFTQEKKEKKKDLSGLLENNF